MKRCWYCQNETTSVNETTLCGIQTILSALKRQGEETIQKQWKKRIAQRKLWRILLFVCSTT